MSTIIQPPPTWTLPIDTKNGSFDPVWLKWFIDLAGVLNQNGGAPLLSHNALGGLQGGKVGPPKEYYHLNAAQDGLFTSGLSSQVLHGDPTLPTWSSVSLINDISGVLPIANGGSNSSTALSSSSIMVSNGSSIVQGAPGTATTVLHGNASGTPTYSSVSLTADVTGTLPVANGGTGSASAPSSGQLLVGNAGGTAYAPQSMSGDATINNSGALTLASVVSASTNTKITYSAKGLVTAGAQAAAADLSNGVTGSGTIVLATSPSLTTPTLGVASATTVNKVAITAPATSATLTIANGATLTASASATVSGTNTGDQTVPTAANPAAAVGLTDVNGSASTFMRSDAAPHLDQGIIPTWTGKHTHSANVQIGSSTAVALSLGAAAPSSLSALNHVFVGDGTLGSQLGAGGELDLGWNFYYASGFKYKITDIAQRLSFNGSTANALTYEEAPSGTAGNALTWTVVATLSSTGAILPGTTTNNDAAAGKIGEYVTASVASASSVSLTTGTTANVTSISLTAGDWDVTGIVDYTAAGTTVVTALKQGSSSTSATLGAVDTFSTADLGLTGPSNDPAIVIPTNRFSLGSTTTIYLVTNATFSVSTLKAYGTIRARRVR